MKPKNVVTLPVKIELQEIYGALQQRDIILSVANVRALCAYLETTARDAAMSALVDFVQNEIPLHSDTQAKEQ